MKHVQKILALLLAFMMLIPMGTAFAEENKSGALEKWYYEMVFETIKANYPFEMDTEAMARAIAETVLEKHPELLEDVIAATVNQLDDFSGYMTPESTENFDNYVDSEYVGIGAIVERGKGAVVISGILPDSPAQDAGLLPGDRFIQVGDTNVTDYSINQLTALIRGPEGTKVTLIIERNGKKIKVEVMRAAVQQATVDYDLMAKGIGYMQIAMFSPHTPDEIGQADAFFKENKTKKLIIDLRDNPGGELASVINSLGYFVPRGQDLVSISYGDSSRDRTLRSVGDVGSKSYYNRIILLVNGNTASAAELFAGDLQLYGIAKVVGTTTYGKGTVQELIPLMQTDTHILGTIRLTTAEYKLPGGKQVNQVGITPNYIVRNKELPIDTSKMAPMDYVPVYKQGDKNEGVLAIKQRMNALGYYVGDVNDEYDGELVRSTKLLQQALEFPVTGEFSMELQGMLSSLIKEARIKIDAQFEKAYQLAKSGR